MLDLSPAKILVVLVVAVIVLGPEKLPGVARQLGAAWGDLRKWRARLEKEVRGAFPELPPSHHVVQAVRSPLAFLDRLADEHERTRDGSGQPGASARGATGPVEPAADQGAPRGQDGAPPSGRPAPEGDSPRRTPMPDLADGAMIVTPDDPSMN